ncbi:MAG: zinc ribbon domain-containing protein, partial [Bacilli bacterium]
NCIVCGSELPVSGKVCPECGTETEENAKYCPKCGYHFTEESMSTKTCPVCKGVIDKNAKFCPQCGAVLTKVNSNQSQNKSFDRASKVSFILGLIALGCTTIFATFFVVGIVLGIAAVILGIIGLVKKEDKTKSVLGLVFGALGMVIGIAILVIIIIIMSNTAYYLQAYEDYLDQMNELVKIIIYLI